MRALPAATLWVTALCAPLVTAQTFDAASIKLNRAPIFERALIGLQPGRLVANEATLRELVGVAYGARDNEVVGATGWMAVERYDVIGTVPGGTSGGQAQSMLRALLADRFGLKTHRETRSLPVYTLVMSRADSRFGPGLRRAGTECAPPIPPPGVPMPPAPPPPVGPALRPLVAQARARCPTMYFTGMVSARGMPIAGLVDRLERIVSRPVIDRTGLSGEFDIDLYYQTGVGPGGDTGLDGAAPALLSAVQDQLGLKLEARQAPVEVIVVDAAKKPTEN